MLLKKDTNYQCPKCGKIVKYEADTPKPKKTWCESSDSYVRMKKVK